MTQYYRIAREFSDHAVRLSDLQELVDRFSTQIGSQGFPYFTCLETKGRHRPRQKLVTYPRHWVQHYTENHYWDCDRIIEETRSRRTPFAWDDPDVLSKATDRQMRVLKEGQEAGLVNGFTFPIFLESDMSAVVTVATEQRDYDPELMPAFYMMAIYFHHAARRILSRADSGGAPLNLSPRERDCLSWVAEGKSDWVVAEILGISPHTVHAHIENAKRKLNVASRVQAVAIATRHQLIDPHLQ